MSESPAPPTSEPLEAALTSADESLRLNHWLPPQNGIVPRIRIGQRWVNMLWALPIGTAALIVLIAIAQSLRELPGVTAFIKRYPGIFPQANVAGRDGGIERRDLGCQFRLVVAEIGPQGFWQCLRPGKAAFVFEPLHGRHQLIGKAAMLDAVYAARSTIAQRALEQQRGRHLIGGQPFLSSGRSVNQGA